MGDRPLPAFLTEEEASATIGAGATPRALREWRRQGKGPTWVRIGKRVAYPRKQLDDFIRQLADDAISARSA